MNNKSFLIKESHQDLFKLARKVAEKSPDLSRKTGVVFYTKNGTQITAFNDFPMHVQVTPERLERPKKYAYTEHAERNAIYQASRMGLPLRGSRVWVPWFPCAPCARALVQVGVVELICTVPDWTEERYEFVDARTILSEGGVLITFETEDVS